MLEVPSVLLLAAGSDPGTVLLAVFGVFGVFLLVWLGLARAKPPAEAPPPRPPEPAAPTETGAADGPPGEAPPEDEPPRITREEVDEAVAQGWQAEDDPGWETEGAVGRRLRPVPLLIEVLRGGESRACERAIDELVEHGAAAVPALEQALEDPDADVRVDSRKALERIRQA
jgi:hypothetical protein